MGQPNARLILVGGGGLEAELRAQARDLGIEHSVTFAGQVSETRKFELLKAADVFVSTSQHEGFGIVFLEAMAVGLPIISYDFGGQTDFLEDGATGAVVKLNDLETFTQACKKLAQGQVARQAAAAHNLELMERYFIDSCATAYEEVFEQVIQPDRAVVGS